MGIMIVEANPARVGKLAFRLRWCEDMSLWTFIADASDVITTSTDNSLKTGDRVQIYSYDPGNDPDPPDGLEVGTPYWYSSMTATTGKLAASEADLAAGTYVNIKDAGSGTHTISIASSEAQGDYFALVVNARVRAYKEERKRRLKKAGISEKINSGSDAADNDIHPIEGDELAVLFDDDGSVASDIYQTLQGRTVMVLPTASDLTYLWDLKKNLYEHRREISKEDFAELGRYLLKRCR